MTLAYFLVYSIAERKFNEFMQKEILVEKLSNVSSWVEFEFSKCL